MLKVLDSIQQNIPLFFSLECLLSISATVIRSVPFRQTMKADLITKCLKMTNLSAIKAWKIYHYCGHGAYAGCYCDFAGWFKASACFREAGSQESPAGYLAFQTKHLHSSVQTDAVGHVVKLCVILRSQRIPLDQVLNFPCVTAAFKPVN